MELGKSFPTLSPVRAAALLAAMSVCGLVFGQVLSAHGLAPRVGNTSGSHGTTTTAQAPALAPAHKPASTVPVVATHIPATVLSAPRLVAVTAPHATTPETNTLTESDISSIVACLTTTQEAAWQQAQSPLACLPATLGLSGQNGAPMSPRLIPTKGPRGAPPGHGSKSAPKHGHGPRGNGD